MLAKARLFSRSFASVIFGSTTALAFASASFKQPVSPIMIAAVRTTSSEPAAGLSTDEQKNGQIWNRFAESYSKSVIKDQPSYEKKLEITREYLSPQSNVLEFGCGTGGTAILHAPFVNKFHAIDVSSSMIEIAENKAKEAQVQNVKFICTGIESLDVPEESYDVVLGMSILHLVPNKEEAIAKVYKNLKPGGHFISSTICLGDFAKFVGWAASPFSWLGIIPKISVFSKEHLRGCMEDAGFEIEREFHPGHDKAVFLVAKKPGGTSTSQ